MNIAKKKLLIMRKGFDYGFKTYHKHDEEVFNTWNNNPEDNELYRKYIRFGKSYGTYRYEYIAGFFCLLGILILITM